LKAGAKFKTQLPSPERGGGAAHPLPAYAKASAWQGEWNWPAVASAKAAASGRGQHWSAMQSISG